MNGTQWQILSCQTSSQQMPFGIWNCFKECKQIEFVMDDEQAAALVLGRFATRDAGLTEYVARIQRDLLNLFKDHIPRQSFLRTSG